jgi:rod shape-determining protein MreC
LKEFFKKKGLITLIIAIVVALIAFITVSLSANNSSFLSDIGNTISKPVKSFMSSVVNSLEQIYGYIYEYDKLEAENESLKAQIAELEQEHREYADIYEENDRLRALLELSERHSDFTYETATIISWTSSSWESTCTINKGSSSGLELGDCIITENGFLVGQITALDSTTSTVTTILDTSSSIGALLSSTSEAAIAQGDFSLMTEKLLKLSYLPDGTNIVSGDTIVSSGKGGTFPQGLVIGHITGRVTSESGLDDYAIIEPAVDFDNVSHVYVITDFDVSE